MISVNACPPVGLYEGSKGLLSMPESQLAMPGDLGRAFAEERLSTIHNHATTEDKLREIGCYLESNALKPPYHNSSSYRADLIGAAESYVDYILTGEEQSILVKLRLLDKALSLTDKVTVGRDIAESALFAHPGFYEGFTPRNPEGVAYRNIILSLCEKEGVGKEHFLEDTYNYSEPAAQADFMPATALRWLSMLSNDDLRLANGTDLAELEPFLPLVEEINKAMAEHYGLEINRILPLKAWTFISDILSLRRYGEEYSKQIIDFLNHPDSNQYIATLADLSFYADTACWVFPERYREGAVNGMRHLMADAMFALNYHFQNGKNIDFDVPLSNSQSTLPFRVKNDEPLQILDGLLAAVKIMCKSNVAVPHMVDYWELKTIRVNQPNGFTYYRLFDKSHINNCNVYIRSEGAYAYDQRLEYGRLGKGVESSISYVIDPYIQPGELMEVGKHRQAGPDDRISIRLDREGVRQAEYSQSGVKRDPTQLEGTVSLDVGSVFGAEKRLGTRVGRFLALGNVLRTQFTHTKFQLNHVTHYFSPQDGLADIFAEEANRLGDQLESLRLTPAEVTQHFAGTVVLRSSGSHQSKQLP